MRFKQFLESTVETFHNLIHHIAEEELVACKVLEVKARGEKAIDIYADCQDVPRNEGLQVDLTEKLQARLQLHPLQRLNELKCQVFHFNADQYTLS